MKKILPWTWPRPIWGYFVTSEMVHAKLYL